MLYLFKTVVFSLVIGLGLAEEAFGTTEDSFPNAMSLHNSLRKKHHVPPLTLDHKLTRTAQNRAEIVAEANQLSPDPKNAYGENLAYFSNTVSPDDAATQAVQMWYDEVKDYNFKYPGFEMTTGHFTQVVWKQSTKVGFGVATASNGATYVSALYDPPGNSGYDRDYYNSVLVI